MRSFKVWAASAVAAGVCPMVSVVDGSMTSSVAEPPEGTNAPSIYKSDGCKPRTICMPRNRCKVRRMKELQALAVATGALLLAVAAVAVPLILTRAHRAQEANGAVPYSAPALATLRASGRPVFLYFTADWCVTCKINEAGAIDTPDVVRAFTRQKVAVMVGDWTRGDPEITRFLEANGRSGVPLYLYYAPGAASGQVLPQLLTPGTLTALVGT